MIENSCEQEWREIVAAMSPGDRRVAFGLAIEGAAMVLRRFRKQSHVDFDAFAELQKWFGELNIEPADQERLLRL